MALDSCPKIACHGEILGENRVHSPSQKIKHNNNTVSFGSDFRDKNPHSAIDILFPENDLCVGFNMLLRHFFNPKTLVFVDEFLNRSPLIIHLWRKDLVLRFKSEILFKFNAGNLEIDYVKNLSVDDFIQDFATQATMMIRVMNYLNGFNLKSSVCYFEDVFSSTATFSQSASLEKIFADIGVGGRWNAKLPRDVQREKAEKSEQASELLSQKIIELEPKLQEFRSVSIETLLKNELAFRQ